MLRIQAAWRGKAGRSAAQEQKAIDERRKTLTENLPPPQLFEGRERVLEVKTNEGLLSLSPPFSFTWIIPIAATNESDQ